MTENYIKKAKTKNKPYTQIENDMLRIKEMSWKATGLYAYLCSMPDDWKIYASDLKNRKKDGKDSVTAGLKELKDLGFLRTFPKKNDKGQVEYWVTEFYENRAENPDFKAISPETENPELENPSSGKPVTTNKHNINKTNNKELSIINNIVIIDDLIQEIKTKSKALSKDNLYELNEKELTLLENSIPKTEEELLKISMPSPPAVLMFALLTEGKCKKALDIDVNRKSLAKVLITFIKEFGLPNGSDVNKIGSFLREKVQPNIICRALRNMKHEGANMDELDFHIGKVKELDKVNRMKYQNERFTEQKKQKNEENNLRRISDFDSF